jgi:hypothetical protein
VALEPGQAPVECLQSCDPIGDLGTSSLDEPRQLGRRVRAVAAVAPAGDLRGSLEGDVEAAQVDEQSEVLRVGFAVLALRVVASTRAWQPAGALVEAHRVGGHADLSSQFTDPHRRSKPWSRSDVKRHHPGSAACHDGGMSTLLIVDDDRWRSAFPTSRPSTGPAERP